MKSGEVAIATRRLTDGLLRGDYPYIWGFLKCDPDYDEFIHYPFAIRFAFAYKDSSDEDYDISDDKMKQCPDFEPISIVDSEFETKLRDNFKKVYDFITRDIDSFFKKNAERYEELKKELTAYINSPDTGLGALEHIKEIIDEDLS